MSIIFRFDIATYFKSKAFIIALVALIGIGIFSGLQFNLTIGEGVYLNSPYSIGFMIGLLSLSIIFIATVIAYHLLFKEWDNRFDSILYCTDIKKQQFFSGRILSFITITFFCFLVMILGFALGQFFRHNENMSPSFHLLYYIYPLLIFGFVNALLICSVLAGLAWTSKNKLLMATGGLLIYIAYMIAMIFSNSPFMANSSPQSLVAQNISAITDPFGLSAYFSASSHFTPVQRNEQLVPLTGVFLLNRIIILLFTGVLVFINYKKFSFSSNRKKHTSKKQSEGEVKGTATLHEKPVFTAITHQNKPAAFQSIISFAKTDLLYLFKNIPLIITTLLLLFYLGMEMYAEIEKGIRLPLKYASSGLMAETINENLHFLGILAGAYFINDIFWRSKDSRFFNIESTTYYSFVSIIGHSMTVIVLQLFFTIASICLAILFQIGYGYTNFSSNAYIGVLLFTTAPIILFCIFTLLLNHILPNKYIALAVSLLAALLLTTSLSKNIIPNPLLRFFTGYSGSYSDFIGYGTYIALLAKRQFFGLSLILFFGIIAKLFYSRKKILFYSISATFLAIATLLQGLSFLNGYEPKSNETTFKKAWQYEHKYKHYTSIPQPVVTDVKTSIDAYPSSQSYSIKGFYIINNKNTKPVESILLEFGEGFSIQQANYISGNEIIPITKTLSEIKLSKKLLPGDTAKIDFIISYQWKPINGHDPFNAIIENGSFMRISRYYPRIGYQSENEINDSTERKKRGLGHQLALKKLEDTTRSYPDLINLNMVLSTEKGQTAIGTGILVKEWKEGNRNFYQYTSGQPIPFRFAISSARYAMKKAIHNGIKISVFYHPSHNENVDQLIKNSKLALDYCIQNFGPLPFPAVTFAELSSFTSGFAATAYPGTIFMTEQMTFHANISTNTQQDVINELAGHELSHLWWGCSQIIPDNRQGAAMLTETLAMYTEMMVYKKLYGTEKMNERLKIHEQMYHAEKGFFASEPLYKVSSGSTHISYSKGALVMIELSNLIGEELVNKALSNFLFSFKYTSLMPITTDLINEILNVSNPIYHQKIRNLFMQSN